MPHAPPFSLSDFHGLPALELRSGDGARATVLLHGAHIVSWKTPDGTEQLYLSPQAVLDGRQPVRGGVPIVFPQFDQRGELPKHGFARNREWRALSLEQRGSDALAVLRLVDDDETLALWPHRFVAELSVHISGSRLDVELALEHRESEEEAPAAPPLCFTAALHTYLKVAEASRASLSGLQRLRYFDKVRSSEQVDHAPQLVPQGELDRIYFDAARPLMLDDGGRRVEISMHGFRDVVVWNPGAELATRLSDLPDDGWRGMLCVEAASIGRAVEVLPGECWVGRQTIDAGAAGQAAAADAD